MKQLIGRNKIKKDCQNKTKIDRDMTENILQIWPILGNLCAYKILKLSSCPLKTPIYLLSLGRMSIKSETY